MAGSIGAKFMRLIGIETNDPDDIDQYDYRGNDDYYSQQGYQSSYQNSRNNQYNEPRVTNISQKKSQRNQNVVPLHGAKPDAMRYRLKISQMAGFEDACEVIEELHIGNPVLVNIELLDAETAQRVIDYLSGAMYAMKATLKKAARSSYMLAPRDVEISGDYGEDVRPKTGLFGR